MSVVVIYQSVVMLRCIGAEAQFQSRLLNHIAQSQLICPCGRSVIMIYNFVDDAAAANVRNIGMA